VLVVPSPNVHRNVSGSPVLLACRNVNCRVVAVVMPVVGVNRWRRAVVVDLTRLVTDPSRRSYHGA
jgi:hypothetical protein